jgi:hypothetical protein
LKTKKVKVVKNKVVPKAKDSAVVAPAVATAPVAASPAPVVNAPLEDLEKAPVDPKSAAIGAASGAKEDVPSTTSPAVVASPSADTIAKDDEESIEAPLKPKIEKKKVVEEEE